MHTAPQKNNPSQAEWRRGLLIVSGVLFVVLLVLYASTLTYHGGWIRETNGFVLGRDFLNFWMAGRAALGSEPSRYYDPTTYTALLEHLLHSRYHQQWSYPPTILLAAAPFGLLPYFVAYALWTVLGIAALWVAARLMGPRRLVGLLLVSPAAWLCFISGQNALLTTAGIIAAFYWRNSRPMLAGIVLGLLTLKPQVGLLFPILLLAERNWKCMVPAAATALALVGLVLGIYGPHMWAVYWQVGMPEQSDVIRHLATTIAVFQPTLYTQFWLMGANYQTAVMLQSVVALVMVIISYPIFRRKLDEVTKFAWFAFASILLTPYLMAYDLLPMSFACLLMAWQMELTLRERVTITAMFFLPVLQLFGVLTGIPIILIPLTAMALLLWRRLR